jgi:hypothetical protein
VKGAGQWIWPPAGWRSFHGVPCANGFMAFIVPEPAYNGDPGQTPPFLPF